MRARDERLMAAALIRSNQGQLLRDVAAEAARHAAYVHSQIATVKRDSPQSPAITQLDLLAVDADAHSDAVKEIADKVSRNLV